MRVGALRGSGGQDLAETPDGCRWRITSVSQVIKCPSHPCRRAEQPRNLFQPPSVRRAGATIWLYIRSVCDLYQQMAKMLVKCVIRNVKTEYAI